MTKTDKKIVRIANGQGFWGDSILGPIRLLREGPIDYLTLDYLAEVTMSILQKQQSRDPNMGYAYDFIQLLDRILPEAVEKGVKIISNAGGVNPEACLEATRQIIQKNKLKNLRVATVAGDDIFSEIPTLLESGEPLRNMDTGEPLQKIQDRVLSANVYLGAQPVAEALDQGADIVICGRVTDPALVLGPMLHEFGWQTDDYDKLAAGTVAGHIVECGAQCSGANYSNWREIENYAMIGYPIIEMAVDGSFHITKHAGTGGAIKYETIASQLLYEMGNPKHYITPDVIADFTTIRLNNDGKDRVKITSVKGKEPTDTLKVSISYANGYKALGQLVIAGPDAMEKAQLCAEIIWQRLAFDGVEFAKQDKIVELLGTGECHKGITENRELPEVVLRIGVRDMDKEKVRRFGMEIVPVVTSGPPGVTGYAGGRPKPTRIVSYWPALIEKERIKPTVKVVAF